MRFGPRSSAAVALCLLSVLIASPAQAVRRRAFVTSVTGNGNLSSWPAAGGQTGLAAGDAICRARAAAAALPNAATYRAWLSTTTTDAYCHVQGLTGKRDQNCGQAAPPTAGGPWYLFNGLGTFTGPLPELTSTQGTLYRPVMFDELGNQLGAESAGFYWTGTTQWGQANSTCGDWTSSASGTIGTVGSPQQTARGWSLANNYACDGNRPLLCLEPGASEAAGTWGWSPGAIVFVSSAQGSGDLSSWPLAHGQTGLAAGDEICRSLAAGAHLPSPAGFRAWLSDGFDDAADRITVDTFFQRVDGYRVATSRAALLGGQPTNSIHVDENGQYLTDDA